jgi:hemolysin III
MEEEKNKLPESAAGNPSCEARDWSKEFHRSSGEEWANAATHLAGLVFGIFALTFMCVLAAQRGDAVRIVSCAIYGTTLIVLYNFSMLYHLIWKWRVKAVFQIMDHISIYLLIAGTYTPVLLQYMEGLHGWVFTAVMWCCAALGILIKLCWFGAPRWLQTVLYVAMGWAVLFDISVLQAMDGIAVALLAAGGISYTLGAVIYLVKKPNITPRFGFHELFHIFVLLGSLFHFIMIFCYIA